MTTQDCISSFRRSIDAAPGSFREGTSLDLNDPPIQVGPEMVVERLLCLPLFGVADVVVQEVIFGPTTDASGAGPAKVLNRTKEFEHFRPVFRNGEKPYG